MKRLSPRFALPLVAFIAVPMIYNSCKGGIGSSSFQSQKSCKAVLFKGEVQKSFVDETAVPEPFANKKVKLREDTADQVFAKAQGPVTVAKDSKLAVLVDNVCLQANQQALAETVISKAAADSGQLLPDLDRQAYEWVLDRDYSDIEVEDLATREACVIGVTWNRTYKMQAVFNDSQIFDQRPYLDAIRALQAYDQFYSAQGLSMAGTQANSVRVAVVDTGVDWQHPDITNNMFAFSNGMGIDITTVGSGLVDYNPFDVSAIGHGTHVAGLIAAVSNNGTGGIGAMPYRARIMAIKLFRLENNELTTTSQHFYNAVKFAYDNGAHVINLSLGSLTNGQATDSLAQSAVTEAVQRQVVLVTVIGNADGGQQGREVNGTTLSSIPGQFSTQPGIIGVGSFDATSGAKSSFSHYSTTFAEIGAPGAEQGTTGLYSTKPRSQSSYGRLAGTSQAAPLVTAAAALTIGIIKERYSLPPSAAEVERLILTSAAKNTQLTQFFKQGNRLDLVNLAQLIQTEYPLTRTAGTPPPGQGCP